MTIMPGPLPVMGGFTKNGEKPQNDFNCDLIQLRFEIPFTATKLLVVKYFRFNI